MEVVREVKKTHFALPALDDDVLDVRKSQFKIHKSKLPRMVFLQDALVHHDE